MTKRIPVPLLLAFVFTVGCAGISAPPPRSLENIATPDFVRLFEATKRNIVLIWVERKKDPKDQEGEEDKRLRSSGGGVVRSCAALPSRDFECLIATNHHVIDGAENVLVYPFFDGITVKKKKYQATVLGSDRRTDLAAVRVVMSRKLEPAVAGNSLELRFGGRDHTTAIHSCEKIAKDLMINQELEEEIRLIKDKVFSI